MPVACRTARRQHNNGEESTRFLKKLLRLPTKKVRSHHDEMIAGSQNSPPRNTYQIRSVADLNQYGVRIKWFSFLRTFDGKKK